MKCVIKWNNHTHTKPDLNLFEEMTTQLLEWTHLKINKNCYLYIEFVSSKKMVDLNWELLQHEGDTDVITLDLRWDDEAIDLLAMGSDPEPMGELYISPTVAERQAQLYTNRHYNKELMTYIIHGILHLCGYDDLVPEKRKIMKYYERKWMVKLEKKWGPLTIISPLKKSKLM